MWPFSWSSQSVSEDRDLRADLRELREQVATLASSQRRLQSDFDDLWARFKRFQGRVVKQEAIDAAPVTAPETPAQGNGDRQWRLFELSKGGK